MKREIRFRFWLTADKIMLPVRKLYFDAFGGFEVCSDDFEHLDHLEGSVMQFTGLKDKNGKEIYEGDIIKTTTYIGGNFIENSYKNYTVIWQHYGFTLKPFGEVQYTWSLVFNEDTKIEIIGNIHENPELLT